MNLLIAVVVVRLAPFRHLHRQDVWRKDARRTATTSTKKIHNFVNTFHPKRCIVRKVCDYI